MHYNKLFSSPYYQVLNEVNLKIIIENKRQATILELV